MRYLNKIIFINSAHVPYGEIKLDGNVHFIGTQGVGKSTILRALLFFYNGDKNKLGIPKEKKSFDSFYLEYANSYIVYEVKRETGTYFVVASRIRGRVMYRFVDTAYKQSYFISPSNEVSSEWTNIRERLPQGCYVSPIIERYEEYRNIIFGNVNAIRPEYRKFAIAESAKYQNIPRTIQNVFLNSKLDANFIKDTIIGSMSDEEIAIDLSFFRNQVYDFEQKFTDIARWYKKDKNGVVKIRKEADMVINSYHANLYLQREIKVGIQKLNYVEERDKALLPGLEQERIELTTQKERTERLIDEETKTYQANRDKVVKSLAICTDSLKKIKLKREKYEQLQIEKIIERVEKEDQRKQEKKAQEQILNTLTASFTNIKEKYNTLETKIRQAFESAKNSKMESINAHNAELQQEILRLHDDILQRKQAVLDDLLVRFNDKNDLIAQMKGQVATYKQELVRVENQVHYKEEIERKEQERTQIKDRKVWLENQVELLTQQIKGLQQMAEIEISNKKQEANGQIQPIELKINELLNKKMQLDELIERSKGSLANWISVNNPKWLESYGKLLDEENVLYNTSLDPKITAENDTIFGLKINVNRINRVVRTPEMVKNEKERIEKEIAEATKKRNNIQTSLEKSIAESNTKYTNLIKKIREEKFNNSAELSQIQNKLKKANADFMQLEAKENEWKIAKKERINAEIGKISLQIVQAEEEKKRLEEKRISDEKNLDKVLKNKETEISAKVQAKIDVLITEIAAYETKMKEQIADNEQQLLKELSGAGVDKIAIERTQNKIKAIDLELASIEKSKGDYYGYKKDKEEFFDKEPTLKEEKRKAEEKRNSLEERFERTRKQHNEGLNRIKGSLKTCYERIDDMRKGLEAAAQFREQDSYAEFLSFILEKQETTEPTKAVLENLRVKIRDQQAKLHNFHQNVNQFKSNFSSKNTFNFSTELSTDKDYIIFAEKLYEFIENNKIEEYKNQVSEHYVSILQRISKEVGDIKMKSGDINKVINNVNADFRERNFAGVIKSIELRSERSEDALMRLLESIKEFNDEHRFSFGQLNLFSETEDKTDVTEKTINYLLRLVKVLLNDEHRELLSLKDTFKLEFRIVENDNDTGWIEKISNVGSDGTDILVKAMVNIMLINVFKKSMSRKFQDFSLHCMMDEIGKLHPENVKGILDFANARNIFLVNGSPTSYDVADYKYTYLLKKNNRSMTMIIPLMIQK